MLVGTRRIRTYGYTLAYDKLLRMLGTDSARPCGRFLALIMKAGSKEGKPVSAERAIAKGFSSISLVKRAIDSTEQVVKSASVDVSPFI